MASAVKDGAESTAKAAKDGAQGVVLAAKDRVSLGGVEVSPLGVGAWAWGDTMFWGYSEAMDKELQEVSRPCLRSRSDGVFPKSPLQNGSMLCNT